MSPDFLSYANGCSPPTRVANTLASPASFGVVSQNNFLSTGLAVRNKPATERCA